MIAQIVYRGGSISTNLATSNENKNSNIIFSDIAKTLLARDYKGLCNFGSNTVFEIYKIIDGENMSEIKIIGKMDNKEDNSFESANRVYDETGIAPTINTCGGGGLQPKVIDTFCIGGIGDKNSNGGKQYYQQDRVYTMGECAMCHPSQIPEGSYKYLETIKVKQNTLKGYSECELGGVVDLNYTKSKTRRGRVQGKGQISPTLATENIPSVIEPWIWKINGETYLIRIRRLTPRECWRLMDFEDTDFDKAEKCVSASQLYKQAGNSIVVSCLSAIFNQLLDQ